MTQSHRKISFKTRTIKISKQVIWLSYSAIAVYYLEEILLSCEKYRNKKRMNCFTFMNFPKSSTLYKVENYSAMVHYLRKLAKTGVRLEIFIEIDNFFIKLLDFFCWNVENLEHSHYFGLLWGR